MKRRLAPGQLAAIAARGRTREPGSLANDRRDRRGERGHAGASGSFPHGRFCLVVDLDCRRTGETRVLDTRVHRLYRAMW